MAPAQLGKQTSFWSRVTHVEQCWLWTGQLNRLGYGVVRIAGKAKAAHRRAYELDKGEIPDGQCVCHTCDNRACINPAHLYLSTHKERIQECVRKGRHANGSTGKKYVPATPAPKDKTGIVHTGIRGLMPEGFIGLLMADTGLTNAANISALVRYEQSSSQHWHHVLTLAKQHNPEAYMRWAETNPDKLLK